ncbi:MAG: YciI family protein [Rhizomicrobium sp.]
MQRIVPVIAALVLFAASMALPARAQDAADTQHLFVIVYSQGSAWKAGVPMDEQRLKPHYYYWKSLRDAHALFLAGPFTDANGGLVVLRARTIDEARNRMAHDPAVIGKIFVGEIHAWSPGLDSGAAAKDFLAAPE